MNFAAPFRFSHERQRHLRPRRCVFQKTRKVPTRSSTTRCSVRLARRSPAPRRRRSKVAKLACDASRSLCRESAERGIPASSLLHTADRGAVTSKNCNIDGLASAIGGAVGTFSAAGRHRVRGHTSAVISIRKTPRRTKTLRRFVARRLPPTAHTIAQLESREQ